MGPFSLTNQDFLFEFHHCMNFLIISPCRGIKEESQLVRCQSVYCFSEQRVNCEYSEGSVVTPVVTIVKGQRLHLWLQSFFGGSEHICACCCFG